MTTKDLTVAQAKEIARLNGEVQSLKFALSMADHERLQQLEKDMESLAAENAHLLARLSLLGDPNMDALVVELKALAVTGRLVQLIQVRGYQQAGLDVRHFAAGIVNPVLYDTLMSVAMQMDANVARNKVA